MVELFGEEVFVASDRRIALVYTANRDVDGSKYIFRVDLTNVVADKEPLTIIIGGPYGEEDALKTFYGITDNYDHTSIGYLYKLNAKFFQHESELETQWG